MHQAGKVLGIILAPSPVKKRIAHTMQAALTNDPDDYFIRRF